MESKWSLTQKEQETYIKALEDALIELRYAAGISQGDLAHIIGVSRQTYSSIECKRRGMTWSTYLSLIWFFDSNADTYRLLREKNAYPTDLLDRMNESGFDGMADARGFMSHQSEEITEMIGSLDEQGLRSLKTVLLLEYARCKNISGDAVIKAFDGARFTSPASSVSKRGMEAVKNIKRATKHKESDT